MNKIVKEFVDYIITDCPKHDKESVKETIQSKFKLTQDRKVYYCEYFAARISYSKSGSFCNTVLSLSALQKYDHIPFFVILVSANDNNKIFLANSTFLKKISHSSQQLSMTNIKGSFNGSDIIRDYHNIENNAENFEKLFAFHQGFTWEDNLARLVETTSNIVPTGKRFVISDETKCKIIMSISRSLNFIQSKDYEILKVDLDDRVSKCADSILIASHIENVNIRGRLIEALITSDDNERKILMKKLAEDENNLPIYDTKNGLGDYRRTFGNIDSYTDIKTKVIYLGSNPKAFNIDKFLETMSDDKSVFLFYFIGIDDKGILNKILCSVYHNKLIDGTVKQFHWAGRNSRGVTQFIGDILNELLQDKNFKNKIDIEKSKKFIDDLIGYN